MSKNRLERNKSRWLSLLLMASTLMATGLLSIGCSRERYRMNADQEVYGLLNTVNQQDPLWEMEDFNIDQGSCSRYSSFYNPDAQPMPQDDGTAHRLMESVDGMRGYKKWGKNGYVDSVENPNWVQTLPYNEKGEVVLDQDAVFDLALTHSPAYRTAMENLYLAALDVTAERYAFDVKFYGGDSLFYNNVGGFKKGSYSTLSNQLGGGNFGVGSPLMSRHFATGADMVVGIANSMVWTFAPGDQSFRPVTELSYNITQPLLRGAGRAVALESLTLSERRLLANVRQLAFFQQGFYVGVLTGSNPISSPSGGGYPGAFTGSAGLGGGYYGLLQSQTRIRNQQSQVASYKDNLNQYEEYFKAGRLEDSYQVEEIRNQLLNSQSTLVQLKDRYESDIDSYLISLGLPPDIEGVKIEDKLLAQFTLMSPTLTEISEDVNEQLGILRNELKPTPADIQERIRGYWDQTVVGVDEIVEDFRKLDEVVPSRKNALATLMERLKEEQPELDRSFCDLDNFEEKIRQIKDDFEDARENLNDIYRLMETTILAYDQETLTEMIHATLKNPEESPFSEEVIGLIKKLKLEKAFEVDEIIEKQKLKESLTNDPVMREILAAEDSKTSHKEVYDIKEAYRNWVSICLNDFAEKLTTIRLVQTRARLETVQLPIVDIGSREAFAVARENRLDWMNARSELVDVWRNIEVTANALKAVLDVSVGGSIASEGSNMVDFRSDNASMNASLKFDAPLDRLAERNAYRRALINYDQARRQYYTYVDTVNMQIRNMLREIYRNQMDLELKRESVRVAVVRVHLAQLKLSKPTGSTSSRSMASTIARDLVEALNSLLQSQNNFMETWLQYQVQRMSLLLQLGLFEIDEHGRWIDPGEIDQNFLIRANAGNFLPQDQLFGMDRLQDVETITGGLSADDLRATLPREEDPSATDRLVEGQPSERSDRSHVTLPAVPTPSDSRGMSASTNPDRVRPEAGVFGDNPTNHGTTSSSSRRFFRQDEGRVPLADQLPPSPAMGADLALNESPSSF